MSKAKEEYEEYKKTKHEVRNKKCWVCEKYIEELEEEKKELLKAFENVMNKVLENE